MAGEGIEYNWGCAKGYYHRLPIREKRTKNKFRESVKKSISREIMTIERQRMFSCRARQYMLAYHAIDNSSGNNNNNNNNNEPNEAITAATTGGNRTNEEKKTTFALIETIIKNYKHTYKTHRSVADSDTGYINEVVSAMKMASYMQEQQLVEASDQQQQQTEQGRISSGSVRSESRWPDLQFLLFGYFFVVGYGTFFTNVAWFRAILFCFVLIGLYLYLYQATGFYRMLFCIKRQL